MKKGSLPSDFSLKEDGLYFEEDWLSSPITVLAHTRDDNSESWGRLVQFSDLDQHCHELTIPLDTDVATFLWTRKLESTSHKFRSIQ